MLIFANSSVIFFAKPSLWLSNRLLSRSAPTFLNTSAVTRMKIEGLEGEGGSFFYTKCLRPFAFPSQRQIWALLSESWHSPRVIGWTIVSFLSPRIGRYHWYHPFSWLLQWILQPNRSSIHCTFFTATLTISTQFAIVIRIVFVDDVLR